MSHIATYQDLTMAFICVIAFIAIAFDIWVKIKDPSGDSTISWVSRIQASKWPIIAVGVGIVVGHIFWPNCS